MSFDPSTARPLAAIEAEGRRCVPPAEGESNVAFEHDGRSTHVAERSEIVL